LVTTANLTSVGATDVEDEEDDNDDDADDDEDDGDGNGADDDEDTNVADVADFEDFEVVSLAGCFRLRDLGGFVVTDFKGAIGALIAAARGLALPSTSPYF